MTILIFENKKYRNYIEKTSQNSTTVFIIKSSIGINLAQKTINKNDIRDLDFDSIFEIDESIRFVGVCTKDGRLLDAQYKNGIKPLLTDSGLQLSVMRTAIRSTTRTADEGLMGHPLYSVTTYENVKRATIPLDDDLLFLTSFDRESAEGFIIPKILHVLNN